MSYFEWDPILSVGIPEIDEEHKKWLLYLNELQISIENKTERGLLCDLLDRISVFSEKHFRHEEALFSNTNYPYTKEHKAVHAGFLKELERSKSLCLEGAGASAAAALFLKRWLINHVQEMDMQYASYVKEAQTAKKV